MIIVTTDLRLPWIYRVVNLSHHSNPQVKQTSRNGKHLAETPGRQQVLKHYHTRDKVKRTFILV